MTKYNTCKQRAKHLHAEPYADSLEENESAYDVGLKYFPIGKKIENDFFWVFEYKRVTKIKQKE